MIDYINSQKSKQNILIVGGSGFIGSNIALRLPEKKYNVTIISKSGKCDVLENKKIRIIKLDISKPKETNLFFENSNFDFIINAAGYINHSSFLENGLQVIDNHFNGVINLLNSVKNKKIKHFINIGSSDEYGKNNCPQVEVMKEIPFSTYSFAKLASTQLLQMLYRSESFPVTTVRLFITYGNNQKKDRLIPFVIDKCLKNQSFKLSKGEQLRDFCHISDIASGILSILENKKTFGEVINLGSGQPISIKEIVQMISRQIGKGNPEFGKIPYRKGENMCLYADISKAKQLMNWKPLVSLEEGLKKTIFHTENEINK